MVGSKSSCTTAATTSRTRVGDGVGGLVILMAVSSKCLKDIHIASPCTAAWSDMDGDDKFRFCKQCRKYVYNLSAMSRPEAEALVEKMEGRMCVRFYRRADGTVLTDDCPVGLRRAREAMHWSLARLAAGVAFFLALMGLPELRWGDAKGKRGLLAALRQIEPIGRVIEWLDPTPPPPPTTCLMGSMLEE
jgi:hypothetical protein